MSEEWTCKFCGSNKPLIDSEYWSDGKLCPDCYTLYDKKDLKPIDPPLEQHKPVDEKKKFDPVQFQKENPNLCDQIAGEREKRLDDHQDLLGNGKYSID